MTKRELGNIKHECAPKSAFRRQIGENRTIIVDGYGLLGNLSLKIGRTHIELNQFNRAYTQDFQTYFVLKKETGICKC